ncbi:MAG: 1-acyl-sn-glycerol-3-phosphate acyltransferase [Anaerolineae bacterium]|nr:1-acyl-sn-glycerol-3-phosphate acyltransferase [Anaerolineae bacterium]
MINRLLYWLGWGIIQLYARLMFRLDAFHHAPLPDGPKIVVANHPSTTDPFLVMALVSSRVSILIIETLFKVPVFGRYLRHIGHVPVIPGNGQVAFERARQLLQAGHTVVIFPEGDLSPAEGGFLRPRTGAARLALATGAPVIPIGIHLQHDRIHRVETMVDGKVEIGCWYLRGPYAFTMGEAMYFEGDVEDRPHVRAISEHIMQAIVQLVQRSAYRLQAA